MMKDQQRQCQNPGVAAAMGRGLGSRHNLCLGMVTSVHYLPNVTQKQAADQRLENGDISSKIMFGTGYKKMLMDRGQELYCCADL